MRATLRRRRLFRRAPPVPVPLEGVFFSGKFAILSIERYTVRGNPQKQKTS